MNDYIKYQHVEKFGSDEVDGIEFGNCYIFPKIDGTNAHIWYRDGQLKCGSRRRQLDLENDNAGFMNWAINQEALIGVARHFSGLHVFGEWLVPHSLKTYREDAWKRFYIFDIYNPESKLHVPYDEYQPVLEKFGVDYIAPIRILKNPRIEDVEKCLKENQFLIEDGKGPGEGVVLKNYDFVNRFGRQTWAKMITSEFKEKHYKEMGAPVSTCSSYVEELMVNEYLTPPMIEKVYANIKSEQGWDSKKIPQLLGIVYYDFVRECIWDAVKTHKNPSVNFSRLQKFVNKKVKEVMAHLF